MNYSNGISTKFCARNLSTAHKVSLHRCKLINMPQAFKNIIMNMCAEFVTCVVLFFGQPLKTHLQLQVKNSNFLFGVFVCASALTRNSCANKCRENCIALVSTYVHCSTVQCTIFILQCALCSVHCVL